MKHKTSWKTRLRFEFASGLMLVLMVVILVVTIIEDLFTSLEKMLDGAYTRLERWRGATAGAL